MRAMSGKTLYDKIWDAHVVSTDANGESVLYIDLHLIHEVTTPQAFAGLKAARRGVRRPERTLAVADHNVPTEGQALGVAAVADEEARLQLQTLERNVNQYGIEFFPMGDVRNGIVHVVGPEQGRTQPGMTIVCGDSHTSTHGAFGALAQGIGTSEVEHVLATQTLRQRKSKNMRVSFVGTPQPGVGAKDYALAMIGKIGAAGGAGHVIEYAGEAVRALSMEERMTLCNMTIEAGARAGMIAPDEITFSYLKGRRYAPQGENWQEAVTRWQNLKSDDSAHFDRIVDIDATAMAPFVTWGTNPAMASAVNSAVPDPNKLQAEGERRAAERALEYMALRPGTPLQQIPIDVVFIGSCTNARIEDLRAAAQVIHGYKVHNGVRALVVPGSQAVKREAEAEGIDEIFRSAGFEWRQPGCSMCLGMNEDILAPGQRCASTSNRNFEGRQGRGGRTHLMSPAMAAAAAITGRFTDIREWRYL